MNFLSPPIPLSLSSITFSCSASAATLAVYSTQSLTLSSYALIVPLISSSWALISAFSFSIFCSSVSSTCSSASSSFFPPFAFPPFFSLAFFSSSSLRLRSSSSAFSLASSSSFLLRSSSSSLSLSASASYSFLVNFLPLVLTDFLLFSSSALLELRASYCNFCSPFYFSLSSCYRRLSRLLQFFCIFAISFSNQV